MRYSTLIVPIALLAIPATANAAGCQPAFVGGDQAVVIDGVDIGPGERATRDFSVRVKNTAGSSGQPGATDGGPCGVTIRVARVGASSIPDLPAYLMSAPGNNQIEILPDSASGGSRNSDVVIANAPSGQQGRNVPFQITVPTEWGLQAGTFTDELQLLLIDQGGNIVDRSTLTVTIIVPSTVSLRLVGAVVGGGGSGPAQVDLGYLSSSKETRSDRFGALIFSTAPYAVRFSSTNLGSLLHEQKHEKVPYRLYFDGILVDLAGTNEFSYPTRAPKGGDTRPMSIVVPPVVALAGRYSDRITVTVTAL